MPATSMQRNIVALALVGVACASPPRAVVSPGAPPAAASAATRLADHHVHLLGPGLLRDWRALGAQFSRADPAHLTADGLLQGIDGQPAEVERVVLVPMAHLYGSSEFRSGLALSLDDERARLAAENDHVAREAARWSGRALALCSVSVLRPYAWEELRRCRTDLQSSGLKLHLASSEVDLRRAEHLAAVEAIAGWAETEGLPILLHLDPQLRGHTGEDIRRFARVVLEPHPRLTVVVAHLGGSGGYGPWTRSVFTALLDWLEEGAAAGDPRPEVRFDLSAVVLEEASEGVPPTTAEEAAALAADLRRAGFARLLLGSDYPVFAPRRTARLLAERAGLTPGELATLLAARLTFPARATRQGASPIR